MLELKSGDKVVRSLTGGGFTTHSIVEIEEVNKKGIFIEGCDGDFSKDSVYGYNFKGAPLSGHVTGFRSELLRLATKSDLKSFEEI